MLLCFELYRYYIIKYFQFFFYSKLISGVRLYFITYHSYTSITNDNQNYSNMYKNRPNGLYLVHVRLPPGFTGTTLQRPTAVHSAHYNAGNSIENFVQPFFISSHQYFGFTILRLKICRLIFFNSRFYVILTIETCLL